LERLRKSNGKRKKTTGNEAVQNPDDCSGGLCRHLSHLSVQPGSDEFLNFTCSGKEAYKTIPAAGIRQQQVFDRLVN
jgi:hypothetical protein